MNQCLLRLVCRLELKKERKKKLIFLKIFAVEREEKNYKGSETREEKLKNVKCNVLGNLLFNKARKQRHHSTELLYRNENHFNIKIYRLPRENDE